MARIRHFDHHHATVAEVRACPGRNSARIPETAYVNPEPPSTCLGSGDPAPEFVTNPATPAQVRYIKSLADQREIAGLDPATIETMMDADDDKPISFREARHALDALEKAPAKAGAKAAGATGPGGYPVFEDGYYALRDEEGTVHFYSLVHEDESRGSKYAGWPVLRAQASDELHLIRKRETKFEVINAINEDPKAARLLYADELGNCYVCGRTLTDETSRRLGIGPVCRGKHPALVYEREAV